MVRRVTLVGIGIGLLSSCSIFQSRVNDETRVLRTAPLDPIWDLELYERPLSKATDTLPQLDLFQDSGRYYSFRDRMIWYMIAHHLDSMRMATNRMTSRQEVDEWYRTVRPRIADTLYAKYPGEYRRFEGELHFTGDTVWHWLGDMDNFETCGRTMTLAQLFKPDHWYLFVFDNGGPTHSLGRRHYVQRRVSFLIDSNGNVQHWLSVRRRMRNMGIV